MNSSRLSKFIPEAVIVDTNIFWGDLRLKGSFWRRLIILRREGFVRIYFPEVVIREMVRHQRRQLHVSLNAAIDKVDDLASHEEVLSELGVSFDAASKKELRERRNYLLASSRYEDELRETVNKEAEILPLPHLDAEDMLAAYIEGKKPFKEDGSGLADYIIWQTVRQHAEAAEGLDVFLLTDNRKDFAEACALHADLRATLRSPGSVQVYLGADALLDAHEAHFDYIEGSLALEFSESSEVLAMAAAQAYAEQELVGTEISWVDTEPYPSGLEISGFHLPSGLESPSVEWVEMDEETSSWHPYEVYDETTEAGQLECEAELTIVGYLYRSDAVLAAESGGFDSIDFGSPDDHYAEVRLSIRVALRLNVRVERDYQADVEHLDEILLA